MNRTLLKWTSRRAVVVAASLAPGPRLTTPGLAAPAPAAASGVSDAQITAHVIDGLTSVESLKGANIDVKTVDGVVTLSGTVRDWHAKFAAVAAADSVKGVRILNDDLKTEPLGGANVDPRSGRPAARRAIPDARITTDVQQLLAHSVAKPYAVQAKTDHGVVYLSGNVMDGNAVARLKDKVAKVDGVKRVDTHALDYSFLTVAY